MKGGVINTSNKDEPGGEFFLHISILHIYHFGFSFLSLSSSSYLSLSNKSSSLKEALIILLVVLAEAIYFLNVTKEADFTLMMFSIPIIY